MSWVPSPSPRLAASYREVQAPHAIPTVLGAVPARGPLLSPTAASCAPSALSFGTTTAAPPSLGMMAPPSMPYQAPRPPQQRQGSFTPLPSTVQASPTAHRGMNPSLAQLNTPYRLGTMNNIPYAAPASTPARDSAFQNRSWTPLPSNSVLGGLERPKPSALDDRLSHSLTVLPLDFNFNATDLLASPAGSPLADQHLTNGFSSMGGGFANGDDARLMTNGLALMNGTESSSIESRQFSHKPKQRSFSQAPMPVIANIYWQRPVAFDQQGRVQRRLGGDDLSWRQKFLKDVLGVYHVGIEVHGQEYTFGHYRAPGARMVGREGSGVYCHEPRRPGPQCVFKSSETLGSTTVAPGQVENICSSYGSADWSKASYNKIHHNCVDFARTLASKLGAGEIPAWCYRGAAIAKVMGLGGDPLEDDSQEMSVFEQPTEMQPEANTLQVYRPPVDTASMFPAPALLGDPGINFRQAEMDWASRSRAGTYVAPPPLPGPLSRNGTYVAPPPLSGTYVGPPLMPMSVAAAPSASQASFAAGSRVSVLQNGGHWLRGSIVMERPQENVESTYTIMYDDGKTEVNVAQHRLVPLPEGDVAPVMQSFHGAGVKMQPPPVFQGLASADLIPEPLRQGKAPSFGSGSIPLHRNNQQSNGRVAWPQAKAAVPQRPQVPPVASFAMGGVRRHSAGPPPSAMSFGRSAGPPPTATATSAAPSLRSVRPSTGSFRPNSGYPTAAMAPAQAPQMMMPRSNMQRGRDTLGGTTGGTMPRFR